MELTACGSRQRRRPSGAHQHLIRLYTLTAHAAEPYFCSLRRPDRHADILTGLPHARIVYQSAHVADREGFFSRASASILSVSDSSDYGDKRGRNKPIGPGGSTRRLHQMPPKDA